MNYPSPNLDVLRSLAIIFVVLSHLLLDRSLVGVGGYHTQTLGTLGVLIFFVHTCLVLMLSLERQMKKKRNGPTTLLFLVARAFRIYPLSILVVVVLSWIAWMYSDTKPTGLTILSNILLVQNLTGSASITPVLWSLPFELQMYLFLPALYMLIGWSGRFAPHFIVALWCGMVGLVVTIWHFGLNFSLIMFFPCFLPGVLAFSLRRSLRSFSPIVLFLYVAVVAFIYPWVVGHGVKATALSWPICLLLGFLIPKCREIELSWLRIVCSLLARYSYGIYLLHVPIIYFSFHFLKGLSPFASWAIFTFGLTGLAYCAYHVVEKPGTEFGRTIVERLNANRLHAGHNRWWTNF
jgi:peptidoglycan/LPS O-acetylase OafA/YrhL